MSITDTVIRIRGDDATGAVFASVASNNSRMTKSIQAGFEQITRSASQFGNEIQRSGRQAETSLSGTNLALATMATRYLGVAGAITLAKQAFSNFAQLDSQLRTIALQTGKTLGEIEKLKPTFEAWALSSGRDMDEVVEAFNMLRRRSRASIEETVAMFPTLKDAAVVTRQSMVQLAQSAGTMFHTFGIGSADAERAMGAIIYAQQKYNLEVDELLRWGPQLTEMLSGYGEKGVPGIQKLMAYLNILDTAYGNTQRSTRALAEVITTGFDFAPLGARLSMTVEDMRNVMDIQIKAGKSAMDVFLDWVTLAFQRGMKISEFPRQIQPAILALLKNQKEIKNLADATNQGVEAARRGMKTFEEAPEMGFSRLLVQLKETLEEFGAVLDALGVTTGMGALSDLLKNVRVILDEVKTILKGNQVVMEDMPLWLRLYQSRFPTKGAGPSTPPTIGTPTAPTFEERWSGVCGAIPLPRPRPLEAPPRGGSFIDRLKGFFKTSGIETDIQPASFTTGDYVQSRQLDEQRDMSGTLNEIRDILQRAYPEMTGGGGGAIGVGAGAGASGIGSGIGTLGDRQNNPGNIKWGAFAKAHGATGPGVGGHAIFPDYKTGRAALETLLRTKGAGQSIGEIGNWYAQDPGWARGVAQAMGVETSYRPTSDEISRLADAVQRQEGTQVGGFMGGGGGTPDAILQQAQIVAMSGNPAAVSAFMASQGYPKSSAWCGDFVGAVVRSVGGTPPRNASVASNWRNWGYPTDNPQPGDIAVRRSSRYGGYAITGNPGGHVNIFGGYSGKGSFTGIGGNQSRFSQSYPLSDYEFRSATKSAYVDKESEFYKSGRAVPVPNDEEFNRLLQLFSPSTDPATNTGRINMLRQFFQNTAKIPKGTIPHGRTSEYGEQLMRWIDKQVGGGFYTPPGEDPQPRKSSYGERSPEPMVIPIRFEYPPGDAQFRRASIRREVDREMREGRLTSMFDIGSA